MRRVYATTTGLKTAALPASVTVLHVQWSPSPQPDREADLWFQGNVLTATSQLFLDHAVGQLELGPGVELVDGWVWEDGDVRDVTLTVIVDRVCGRGEIHGLLGRVHEVVYQARPSQVRVYQATPTFLEGERWSGMIDSWGYCRHKYCTCLCSWIKRTVENGVFGILYVA